MHDLIDDISAYDYLIMYSVCSLSEKVEEIEDYIDDIFETDTKLLTPIFSHISRDLTPLAEMTNSIIIGASINENRVWKYIIDNEVTDK